MSDILLTDFTQPQFQVAFQSYFAELGIAVTDWMALFQKMNESGNQAFLRLSDDKQVVGFIQFTTIELTSWFFEGHWGFIREFWIAPAYRNKQHGHDLLELVENYFYEQGLRQVILTTDTAERFYEKHGYRLETSLVAKNQDPVYIKALKR